MARPRKASSPGKPGPEDVVQQALNQTRPAMLEHRSRCGRFDRAYTVYRGDVPAWKAGWQSRNHPKYAMANIAQAVANLAEGVPTATVKPRRPGDEFAAEALENTLNYFAERDHLAEKELAITETALIYAVAIGKTSWHYEEEVVNGRSRATEDRPTFTPWDPYHGWWDPHASSVDTAAYFVLRSYPTKQELLARAYDEESKTGSYRNLDLLFEMGRAPEPETRSAQNMLLMPPPDVLRDRFELLEVWRRDPAGIRLTIIGNRKILLRDGPSPYRMNSFPITVSNSRPDLFRIEGISETEILDDPQRALHTIGNLRLDQMLMTVMRGATVRSTVDRNQLVFRPNFLWPVDDHDDVKPFEVQPLPPEAYREDQVQLQLMQYLSGMTPAVTGASATTGDAANGGTATGNTLANQGASKLLTIKGQIIHNQTWKRTFIQFAALSRQFLSPGTDVRITGQGEEIGWRKYSKGDLAADFDVTIDAGDQSASVQQQRAEMIQLLQVLTPFAQEGLADIKPVLRKVAKTFGFLSPESLIPQQAPPPQPAAPRLTLTGQLTPDQEAQAAQLRGLTGGQGGSWAQPGQPPQTVANGQVSPQPLASITHGNRR